MKALTSISSTLLLLFLTACDRQEEQTAPPAKVQRAAAPSPIAASDSLPDKQSRPDPKMRQATTLTDQIYSAPDDELEVLLQQVVDGDTPSLRQELLTVLYEETRMRSPSVRLPLELEIARSENVDPSLRDTIMAELGSTLQTDHGSSWGDWALALDEYLAATQGLIRIN